MEQVARYPLNPWASGWGRWHATPCKSVDSLSWPKRGHFQAAASLYIHPWEQTLCHGFRYTISVSSWLQITNSDGMYPWVKIRCGWIVMHFTACCGINVRGTILSILTNKKSLKSVCIMWLFHWHEMLTWNVRLLPLCSHIPSSGTLRIFRSALSR